MRLYLVATAASLIAAPARADVVAVAPNGFHLRHSVSLPVPPKAAFEAFGAVEKWWNADHSYSGDPSRLSMQLRPGGCFCETLPGGGVEHMRLAYVDAPRRLVLTGGLGPLLLQAVNGAMDVRVEQSATGSKVSIDYKASGFASGGAEKLAPLVDSVLAEQFARFAAYAGR